MSLADLRKAEACLLSSLLYRTGLESHTGEASSGRFWRPRDNVYPFAVGYHRCHCKAKQFGACGGYFEKIAALFC
jgi:hypothetical protein